MRSGGIGALVAGMIALAGARSTLAGPVTFSGGGTASGPPFPTPSLTLGVFDVDQSLIHTLYVSMENSTPNTGMGLAIRTGGAGGQLIGLDHNKLEIYDYPGSYAQRFDGVGPGGERPPVQVISKSFTPSSFDAVIEFDLPNLPPGDPLFYVLHGQIGAGRPRALSSFVVQPGFGFFDLGISLADIGGTIDANSPVVEMQMTGYASSTPEPGGLGTGVMMSLGSRVAWARRRGAGSATRN